MGAQGTASTTNTVNSQWYQQLMQALVPQEPIPNRNYPGGFETEGGFKRKTRPASYWNAGFGQQYPATFGQQYPATLAQQTSMGGTQLGQLGFGTTTATQALGTIQQPGALTFTGTTTIPQPFQQAYLGLGNHLQIHTAAKPLSNISAVDDTANGTADSSTSGEAK